MFSKNHILYFLMVIAMVTWGMAWSSAKIVNNFLPYNELVFLRFFIGCITMLPFLVRRPISFFSICRKDWWNMIIVSVLFFFYNQCFFMGTDVGQAGRGGVFVTTMNPIVTFIISSWISKKIEITHTLAIFIGIIGGLYILDVFNGGMVKLVFSGNIYFISCAVIWGIMTILMSLGQKNIDSIWYITICYFITSIISIPFIHIGTIFSSSLLQGPFLIHFFIVCNAMSLGTSIYIYAAPRLGAVQVSTFIFSVPFIAMTTAYFVINEPIGINVIIGGILSIFSISIVNYKK